MCAVYVLSRVAFCQLKRILYCIDISHVTDVDRPRKDDDEYWQVPTFTRHFDTKFYHVFRKKTSTITFYSISFRTMLRFTQKLQHNVEL